MHVAKQLFAAQSAETKASSDQVHKLEAAMKWCLAAGANPHLETKAGSAAKLCPDCRLDRIFAETCAPVRSDERSALFIKYVEAYDSADPSCSKAEHAVGQLPVAETARQKRLVSIYRGNKHYAKVNQALRDDEEMAIRHYAGYIFELRNVFKSDNNVTCKPFVGT
eukprot:252972-Amphidinium_carterae.1